MKHKSATVMTALAFVGLSVLGGFTSADASEWAKTYNGPGEGMDYANAVTIDGYGNVYSTGASTSANGKTDYVTAKYTSTGVLKWLVRFDGDAHDQDNAYGVAVDRLGNVYVTGESVGTDLSFDLVTLKYNKNGVLQWSKRFAGTCDDRGRRIAVDHNGNIYVAGMSTGNNSGWDYVVMKYSPTGNQLWAKRFDGPGHDQEYLGDMKIDKEGNVYITGSSVSAEGDRDYCTIKYSSSGKRLWVKYFNGVQMPMRGYDYAQALALDQSGNVYVTGSSYGRSLVRVGRMIRFIFSRDLVTIKYDNSGNVLWAKRYNGPANSDQSAGGIVVDSAGNVYVSGTDGTNFEAVKYSAGGNRIWSYKSETGICYSRWVIGIGLDSQGNIYLGGSGGIPGISDSYDFTVVKLDPGGVQVGVKTHGGSGLGTDYLHSMQVDSAGNVYLAGETQEGGQSDDHDQFWDFATVKLTVN
jgi:uncharacterized delta-60 repeat protein